MLRRVFRQKQFFVCVALLATDALGQEQVLAALLAYRALYYFGPLVLAAFALGVAELIAVQLEHAPGADGVDWITGNIRGVPSAREGKVTRMEQWLAGRGLDWGGVRSTFYTDSMNDIALLEKVDHPVATNPDERLRALAQERGWRILDIFKP